MTLFLLGVLTGVVVVPLLAWLATLTPRERALRDLLKTCEKTRQALNDRERLQDERSKILDERSEMLAQWSDNLDTLSRSQLED